MAVDNLATEASRLGYARSGSHSARLPVSVTVYLTLILLLTLVGSPAPRRVGLAEVALLVTIAASCGVVLAYYSRLRITGGVFAWTVLYGYVLSWVLSGMIGVLAGADGYSVVRAIAPYLIFFPLLLIGFIVGRREAALAVIVSAVFVGSLHAVYLVYLFVSSGGATGVTYDVLYNRTTLLDARVVLPLYLCGGLGVLPGLYIKKLRLCSFAILGVVVVGCLSTQTRAMVLSLLFGIVVYFLLESVRRRGAVAPIAVFRGLCLLLVAGLFGIIVYYSSSYAASMVDALFYRMEMSGDNGRVVNEWIPALMAWVDGGPAAWLFGIGSGESFTTQSGVERSYIHNYLLYVLLYTGLIGVMVISLFYYWLLVSLWRWGIVDKSPVPNALISIVLSFLLYAQLFAVHKLFSFNAVIMIIALAVISSLSVRGAIVRR